MESPVTLITGTGRGIGRSLAEHYLRGGHRVVGVSRGEAGWGADGYHHFTADVTDEEGIREAVRFIRKELGRLDHLINNAGVAAMNHSLVTPLSSVRKVLETNVLGTFLASREAAKLMGKRRWGRIVNFTSVAVPLKLAGESAYAASKSAVESLTQVLAREYAELGITVNAVGPAPVATDLIRGVPEEKIQALLGRQAIPRRATFEDVANVVDFFLRPGSGMVTGQTIYLGGV